MKNLKAVCIFGGAKDKVEAKYKEHAYTVGQKLAQLDINVVYGGARTGVMHAAALGALESGGHVIGIYPDTLKEVERLDINITELIRVKSMYLRKKLMVSKSDVFVVLPGGYGTLDELFEVLTLNVIGFLNKPIIVYNQDGFWNELKMLIEKMVDQGFALAPMHGNLIFAETMEEIFEALKQLDRK
jgi:uncharacterized protein (TIGR00730 family)